MKKLISRTIAIILALSIIISSVVASAAYVRTCLLDNPAYNSWMNGIKDDTLLSDISIPGTHDSAARIVDTFTGNWAQCQNLTITEQLNIGVRFLDLRVRYNTDVYHSVELCHSSITVWNGRGGHLTLYEVIGNVIDFLNANPSETVIVCIKEDDGSNESKIVSAINDIKAENPSKWYQSYTTPTLGQVRGKMVVASRMSSMTGIYYGWGDQGSSGSYVQTSPKTIIQDRYNMGTTEKWNEAIIPTFEYNKPSGTWLINCLNTTGGGISGVSANANTINPAFGRYILHNNKCYGIVTFDYITDVQTSKLIKCNDLVAKNQADNENGQYYYRLNVNNPDSVPSGWSNVSLRLYYRLNNGTANEYSTLLFENGDYYNGYAFVCQTSNYEFSGSLPGYPTRLAFTYNWGYGADRLELDFKLYISKDPKSSYTQIIDTYFDRSSGSSSPCSGTDYYNVDSTKNPVPKTINFRYSSSDTYSVPAVGSGEEYTTNYFTKIYDQYGVKWLGDATSFYLSRDIPGVSFTGNTLKITEQANDNPDGTAVYAMARYQSGNVNITTPLEKEIVLSTKPIPYTFVDDNGTVLQEGSAYYGTTPLYIGNPPQRAYNSSYHYNFAKWTPSSVSTSNRVFKPIYDVAVHSADEIIAGPDATCTKDGYDIAVCSCGYSWHIVKSAIGHSMTSASVIPSCTEAGYDITHCTRCDYVESRTDYPALGHNYDNTIKGAHIDAVNGENGYYPYYCNRCGDELVDLRKYDNNDFSAYYSAVKAYHDILNDPDYSSYSDDARTVMQGKVQYAMNIESLDVVYQYDIDDASTRILTAIDEFSQSVGVVYYTVTFVRADGHIYNTLYKYGTSSADVVIPANSPYSISDDTHIVYKWQTVRDVTSNVSYREIATVSKHTFNTFIFPAVTNAPTCTEQGSTVYRCLCGYEYSESIDPLGHSFNIYVPNYDGTHNVVCSNDSTHYYTEACNTDNADGTCSLCGFELDYSAYYSALIEANSVISNTKKYTANSISSLQKTIDLAKQDIDNARNQMTIDSITNSILNAISNMEIIEYNVNIVYILDNELYKIIPLDKYNYGAEIVFNQPNNTVFYKSTFEDEQGTVRLDSSQSYFVSSNGELTVYYFTK